MALLDECSIDLQEGLPEKIRDTLNGCLTLLTPEFMRGRDVDDLEQLNEVLTPIASDLGGQYTTKVELLSAEIGRKPLVVEAQVEPATLTKFHYFLVN